MICVDSVLGTGCRIPELESQKRDWVKEGFEIELRCIFGPNCRATRATAPSGLAVNMAVVHRECSACKLLLDYEEKENPRLQLELLSMESS